MTIPDPDDPMTRPAVMAQTRRSESLRAQADEAADTAIFLAGLVHHGHPVGECCDAEDCYQAWELYPNG